ncbi:NAD(P)-binding protein [Lepidopterella palustris CBS 459.81]|uniref:NAD(P)-binding protein n=1 Tax=Lepidopterella palustris CBS 459.81 TaxID=1314670 RepID=A0A8E2DXS0_9PEZI|nr:NAD(P)-binding protein [Lepidopterella palustris CBS 459.81]
MANNVQPVDIFKCTSKADFNKQLNIASLRNKSVIVTEGANGKGAAFDTAHAEAGAYVTTADVNADCAHDIAQRLHRERFHVQFISTDVSSFSAQTYAFKAAIAFSPSFIIDIVITCASLNDSPILLYTQVMNTNLTGTFYITHLALRYKCPLGSRAVKATHLHRISSLVLYSPPTSQIYHAAKNHLILGENRPFLRTNLIALTFVRTNMTMGTVDDCVKGVMRIVCDEDVMNKVYGRAMAIVPRIVPGEGERNFDLCDDGEGFCGGREMMEKIEDGTIRNNYWFYIIKITEERQSRL